VQHGGCVPSPGYFEWIDVALDGIVE